MYGGTVSFAVLARVLSAQYCTRMQSASHAQALDLCTPAGLAYCILLHLDYISIPGLVIIPDVVIIPGVVIVPDLDWRAGIALNYMCGFSG